MYLRLLALLNILSGSFVPVLCIALVDGEDFPSLGDGHVGVSQHKLSNCLQMTSEMEIVQIKCSSFHGSLVFSYHTIYSKAREI